LWKEESIEETCGVGVRSMGVGRGRPGRALVPLDFEIFSKKGCFLSFEWEKSNFTTFGPPWKK